MNDREKLIELIITSGKVSGFAGSLADHLIANGVTLDNQVSSSKWISVEERLPLCGERVLITEGNAVFEAYLSDSLKWVRNGMYWVKNGTHWMPLPEPPKGE